jgi:pimeloyl-ACP methyl ester carboxylesterase
VPTLALAGHAIEIVEIPATRKDAADLIFLHEGLGSAAAWRDFPARLAAETGARAIIYSRLGYGKSDPVKLPRWPDYMHRAALEELPALRQALGIANPILIGHSDGGSIALIHAGAGRWPVRALILEAPHVFVEDISIAGIEAAKRAYDAGELKPRLARVHDHVESMFRGWNDIWLSHAFRNWNIESSLPTISCPVLAIQGANDQYGTLAQIAAIQRGVGGRFEKLVLANCGHAPHRDQEAPTREAMAGFIARV